jgi:hypothetical protein
MGTALLCLMLWWGGPRLDGGVAVVGSARTTVLVTDEEGRALPGETVVAVDAGRQVILSLAVCDEAGRTEMILPEQSTAFTVMSPRYRVARLIARGPRERTLVLRALPAPSGTGPSKAPVVRTQPPILIRGRVVDEGGRGLAGVRVDGVRATEWKKTEAGMRAKGVVISSVLSDFGGSFTLPIPSGDIQIQPRAAGLVLVRSTVMTEGGRARADRPVLIMAAPGDADIEDIAPR